jgi:hypothetical protein
LPGSANAREESGGRRLLELLVPIVVRTGLLSALAYYFGVVFTRARSAYFGIDQSTLGFSTQDYLLRSADALFVPLAAVLVTALAGLAVHSLAVPALERASSLVWFGGGVALAGGALFACGVTAVFRPLPFPTYYLFPPISLGLGVSLLAYGVYLLHRSSVLQTGAHPPLLSLLGATVVSLLVVLSMFWARPSTRPRWDAAEARISPQTSARGRASPSSARSGYSWPRPG